MQQFFSQWFWPNPGGWHYADIKVQTALAASLGLVLLSFAIMFWRKRTKNPVTRTLSSSWSAAAATFGIVAAIFVVSRVETIQFLSMKALWVVWAICLILYILFQLISFRNKHYVVVEKCRTVDLRDKYLPRKKK